VVSLGRTLKPGSPSIIASGLSVRKGDAAFTLDGKRKDAFGAGFRAAD
jgi:hypothetical protein